jgi:hypothetical protein
LKAPLTATVQASRARMIKTVLVSHLEVVFERVLQRPHALNIELYVVKDVQLARLRRGARTIQGRQERGMVSG